MFMDHWESFLLQYIFSVVKNVWFGQRCSIALSQEKRIPSYKALKDQLCLLFGGIASGSNNFKPFLMALDLNKWGRKGTLESNLGAFIQTIYSTKRLKMQVYNF